MVGLNQRTSCFCGQPRDPNLTMSLVTFLTPLVPPLPSPPAPLNDNTCEGAAHVLTAFLFAAAGTEPPDDVNRSIGQTYCVGTAGDGPQWLQASSPANALSSHRWRHSAVH